MPTYNDEELIRLCREFAQAIVDNTDDLQATPAASLRSKLSIIRSGARGVVWEIDNRRLPPSDES